LARNNKCRNGVDNVKRFEKVYNLVEAGTRDTRAHEHVPGPHNVEREKTITEASLTAVLELIPRS
jgi:hypothetical protein